MATNKSLRTLKFILPMLAVIFAVVAAFAFKTSSDPKTDTVKPRKNQALDICSQISPNQYVWIKYVCGAVPSVDLTGTPSDPNYLPTNDAGETDPSSIGRFENCGGENLICARLYNCADVVFVDANNAQPIANATPIQTSLCQ